LQIISATRIYPKEAVVEATAFENYVFRPAILAPAAQVGGNAGGAGRFVALKVQTSTAIARSGSGS